VLLAVDVGNTNIVLGAYDGSRLAASWRLATDQHRMPDEWGTQLIGLLAYRGMRLDDLDAAAISSVVPTLTVVFREMCERYLSISPLIVEPGIRTGTRILYDNPREVGADRIVNALAAFHRYGGPAIVIDFGTATTFDAISSGGDYLGGAISPGITVSTEALFRYAAKLPHVELARPKSAIGKNTIASMQAGIVLGYVGLVEGLVKRFQQELGGKAKVIATGGLARIIASETEMIDVVDDDLTLEGLRLVYEMNI
jgi:type III pantothenate kinase